MEHTVFEEKLANLINAGFPYVYIPSHEEERVVSTVSRVAAGQKLVRIPRKVFTWAQTDGICQAGSCPERNTQAPLSALEYIARFEEPGIFILKSPHDSTEPP